MAATVLITGCSSGIGKSTALKFRSAGWNVVATMRDADRWTEPAIDGLLPLSLDVCDGDSISVALKTAFERFGTMDCVVNNAGAGLFSVFEATPMQTMQDVFETNFFGPLKVMRAAIPYFKQSGGGRFINVTSASSISPDPLMTIYGASKAALDSFSESLRYELGPSKIDVKVVIPGFVPTTSFIRQTQSAAESIPIPEPYQGYVHQRLQAYTTKLSFTPISEEDVATAILIAAADDTDRLRFTVGEDAEMMAHMRWETSEKAYNEWTNARFSPTSS
jgi:NAD(P)-dependent dehydrogenase (short-subunit alcohol dehydrogenase family)